MASQKIAAETKKADREAQNATRLMSNENHLLDAVIAAYAKETAATLGDQKKRRAVQVARQAVEAKYVEVLQARQGQRFIRRSLGHANVSEVGGVTVENGVIRHGGQERCLGFTCASMESHETGAKVTLWYQSGGPVLDEIAATAPSSTPWVLDIEPEDVRRAYGLVAVVNHAHKRSVEISSVGGGGG